MRSWPLHTGPRGLDLCLCEWGDPDGAPLLILHGYLEQGAAWQAVAEHLGHRRVVAPDHRGHGLSEHVGPGGFYHFWDYVADVDAVIDALGGRVDLVGHSMGGTLAALVAATVPDKIRSLVLVEGLGPPDGESKALAQARVALKHRREPPGHRPLRDLDEAVSRMRRVNPRLPEATARRLAERQTRPEGDGLVWTWDPLHRSRSPTAFSARGFLSFLGAIEAPTLLIEGDNSPYRGIGGLGARRDAVRNAHLVVLDDTGHFPHHTCPGQLAALIAEHVDARP